MHELEERALIVSRRGKLSNVLLHYGFWKKGTNFFCFVLFFFLFKKRVINFAELILHRLLRHVVLLLSAFSEIKRERVTLENRFWNRFVMWADQDLLESWVHRQLLECFVVYRTKRCENRIRMIFFIPHVKSVRSCVVLYGDERLTQA